MPKLPPVDALEQTALRSDPTTETVAPPQRPSMSRLPVDGDRVGRYVIEGAIARGGTGAVFRAHDPELGRSIAIKLIHPDIAAASDRFEQRLLRESKAMARVAHPNVLTIHDIGRLEGQVFIAMELALGGTLRTWLAAERRDQREVITRFVLAGRGLRAAHEMGLVHRDFKPDNVLLTGDGDVRVADFGLVGHIDAPSHEPGDHASSSDVMLTQVGARMGTPRYMAPEQHEGAQTGAAADQFAFAVAFYEALYDEHPFGGGSWHELAIAVTEGHLRPAPANSDVPPALRKILVRALRVDPQERWPSMTALLDALDAHLARKPVAEPSEPALRARVAQLRRELDDASALAEGGQYEGALPRLRALGADAIAINHPPVAADTLFALGALQNNMGDLRGAEATLTAAVVEAARARDDGLAAKIWNEYMLVLIRAGRLSDAVLLRPAAEAAFARCADDDALAHGQYLNTLGLIAERRGFYPEALASFEGAAHVFEDEFGANSPQLGRAVNNIGYTQQRLGRYREAREAFERAHRIIEVALGPEHPWAAIAINNLGELYVDAGDLTAGLAHHEQAFELRTRALRDDHPHLALSMHNLGVVLTALGRTGEARTHLENALAIRTAGLGDNHVETAESLAALGTTLVADGACDDGVALLRRALAIVADNAWIRRTIASIEDQLGTALLVAGRPAEALDHHERALAILEAAFSPDYPHVARSLAGIARAAQALGQHARAESATARAREIANLRTLA